MLLHCFATIPKQEHRDWLASRLRHHNFPFTKTTTYIALDIEVLSYRTVEKIVSYFEQVETLERSVTLIADTGEIQYDDD